MTLFISRQRAATEAARALLRIREAVDSSVELRRQRNRDGSVDYGFAVILLDHKRQPVATL